MLRQCRPTQQHSNLVVLDINATTQVRTYHQYLVRLMEYKTGGTFPGGKTFTREEFATFNQSMFIDGCV